MEARCLRIKLLLKLLEKARRTRHAFHRVKWPWERKCRGLLVNGVIAMAEFGVDLAHVVDNDRLLVERKAGRLILARLFRFSLAEIDPPERVPVSGQSRHLAKVLFAEAVQGDFCGSGLLGFHGLDG